MRIVASEFVRIIERPRVREDREDRDRRQEHLLKIVEIIPAERMKMAFPRIRLLIHYC